MDPITDQLTDDEEGLLAAPQQSFVAAQARAGELERQLHACRGDATSAVQDTSQRADVAECPPSTGSQSRPARRTDAGHTEDADSTVVTSGRLSTKPPGSMKARHELIPPSHGFFDRAVPHDGATPLPWCRDRFNSRKVTPHLRVGGICGGVGAVAIARGIEAVCGVRVEAIALLLSAPGLAVVLLRDPERESAVVQRALHRTAWMNQRAIYWVRSAPLPVGCISVEAAEEDARRLKLECFAHSMMAGSRLPRQLMTCEPWESRTAASRDSID